MNLSKVTKALFFISAAVTLFGTGYKLGEYRISFKLKNGPKPTIVNISQQKNPQEIDFSLFWETWDKLEAKFVDRDKLDAQTMFYGAVKGMVQAAGDPYTFFLTPDENQQSKDDLAGTFEGIGAELGLEKNQIVIIAPLDNSPAKKAGVKAGDRIFKVDGESTQGWTLQQAVSKIRGTKGSTVTLTLGRGEEELEIEIKRDEIKVDSVELSWEKGVAVLELNRFGNSTAAEWDRAVSEIAGRWRDKAIKGMVLDVRDNPGGLLDGSVYVVSEFVPENALVVTQVGTNGEREERKVTRRGELLDIPLVVLVNQGSASASEIVAGALQDHKRARIVGQKTFGKGSVQEALDLSGDAGLHVTIARWILPEGASIDEKGIVPDVKVENELDDGETLTREKDRQLDQAIKLLVK